MVHIKHIDVCLSVVPIKKGTFSPYLHPPPKLRRSVKVDSTYN
jgi:hypothetical protein